jgi:hypothetical protein
MEFWPFEPRAGEAEIATESEDGLDAAPEAAVSPIEAGLSLEEVSPDEPAAGGEPVEGQPAAQTPAETLETLPNIEPPAGESDTIKDSRQGAEGRRPEEPSDEVKEG